MRPPTLQFSTNRSDALFSFHDAKARGATGSGRPNRALTLQSCRTGGPNLCESGETSTVSARPAPGPATRQNLKTRRTQGAPRVVIIWVDRCDEVFGKRVPIEVNRGLSPLQTAINGDPAMSDFRTADSSTGGRGRYALQFSARPRLRCVPMEVNQGLLPLQTAMNGDPAMSDFQTVDALTRAHQQREFRT
jgi:hypothetical protein